MQITQTVSDIDIGDAWTEPVTFVHRDHVVTLEVQSETEQRNVVTHFLIISVDNHFIHYHEHAHFEEVTRWTWGEVTDEYVQDCVIEIIDDYINSLVRH